MEIQFYVRRAGRWQWRSAPGFPSADDEPHSEAQLTRSLVTYSTMVAHLISDPKVIRFRVLTRHVPTGHLIGHYEWKRSGESGRLIPACEPWTHWAAKLAQAV